MRGNEEMKEEESKVIRVGVTDSKEQKGKIIIIKYQ